MRQSREIEHGDVLLLRNKARLGKIVLEMLYAA